MRLLPNRFLALIGAVALALVAPLAQGWGPEGHAIVADMAQQHLTPAAAADVASLLRLEGLDRLDQVSSWADANRDAFPGTGSWHYVDIPLQADGYQSARDCPQANCVVARLAQFAHVLADHAAAPQARLQALKWVVHLMGDIHQPLHAEDNRDKGGNAVQVQFFGRGSNLHAMWDGGILRHALSLHPGPDYSFDHAAVQVEAMQLDSAITPAQRAAWAPAGLVPQLDHLAAGWADESHRLAQQVAYVDIAKPYGLAWSQRYQDKAWPAVRTRLEQAAVRLAEVLNESLTQ